MNQCPEHDATDSWSSFLWHIDDAGRNGVGESSGPGYFNDLDFLREFVANGGLFCVFFSSTVQNRRLPSAPLHVAEIGFKSLDDEEAGRPLMSDHEYQSEYSIFCLLAAPLIMSNDLTRWTPAMAATLLNVKIPMISYESCNSASVLFVMPTHWRSWVFSARDDHDRPGVSRTLISSPFPARILVFLCITNWPFITQPARDLRQDGHELLC